MEEKSFTKKPFAKKPYRVDAKALESKGFEMIRYDRHESYAKTYRIDGRAFVGTVNPVTGDRTISKAGPFASVKDMEDLRVAWDQLSADVLGPRPTASNSQDSAVVGNNTPAPAASDSPAPGNGFSVTAGGKTSGYVYLGASSVATITSDGTIRYPKSEAKACDDATTIAGSNITCPNCGKSNFSVDHSFTTALAMPTIVRDGRVVKQPDLNKTVTHCTCLECGKQFETTQDPLSLTPAAQETK